MIVTITAKENADSLSLTIVTQNSESLQFNTKPFKYKNSFRIKITFLTHMKENIYTDSGNYKAHCHCVLYF
jgi:hypothetical protein